MTMYVMNGSARDQCIELWWKEVEKGNLYKEACATITGDVRGPHIVRRTEDIREYT
ncbi:hypothetical protein KDAU_63870 [Dictyobacter aurantiacus]|uniref:Uncharacterized protein n=1 Tax=Dictyobacter aurantiacus TaxID=1936993 RepID=A0A401ZQ76_9CHLR|nr:hypothetical protein KDAU_63870 [Dictyobacter aurantiacus]